MYRILLSDNAETNKIDREITEERVTDAIKAQKNRRPSDHDKI